MPGGFVTANCSKCGKKDILAFDEVKGLRIWVSCPECREPMVPGIVEKNYSYECPTCDVYVWLADLLPNWQDIV
jgi:endogenous inhibitor of DNA gyrase (YacG/DUF329 family)